MTDLQILEENTVQLLWAGKELTRGKKLCDFIGRNEKTKVYNFFLRLTRIYHYISTLTLYLRVQIVIRLQSLIPPPASLSGTSFWIFFLVDVFVCLHLFFLPHIKRKFDALLFYFEGGEKSWNKMMTSGLWTTFNSGNTLLNGFRVCWVHSFLSELQRFVSYWDLTAC